MTQPVPLVAHPVYAPLGRRIAATLVDGLLSAVVVAVVMAPLMLTAIGWVALAAGYGAALVLGVIQWVLLGTRGWTVGKRALGLRVLDAATGTPLGLWRALLRSLVLGLVSGFVVPGVVMLFGMGKDPRRQGWHDKAVGSVVVTLAGAPSTGARAPHTGGEQVLGASPAGPVPGPPAGPVIGNYRPAGTPSAPPLAPPPPAAVAGSADTEAAPRIPIVAAPPPMPPAAPGTVAPVVTGPRTDGGMVGPPPGLLSRPAPAKATPPPAPPAASAPPAPPAPPAPQAAPAAPAVRLGPQEDDLTLRSLTPLQAATPPVGEDSATGWLLRAATGASHEVRGETLVGRAPDPAVRPGAEVWALADPEFTVSKTHAALTPWGTTLWLEDLDSTHGVVVRRNGDEMLVEPGTRTRLLVGDTLVLGVVLIKVEAA